MKKSETTKILFRLHQKVSVNSNFKALDIGKRKQNLVGSRYFFHV